MSRPNFLSPAVFPLNLHRLSRFKAHSSNKWCNENVVFCFPQTASCWQSLPGAMMYVIEKFRWNLVGFGHCAPLISRWNPEPENCWFDSFTIKHPGQVPNDQRTHNACYQLLSLICNFCTFRLSGHYILSHRMYDFTPPLETEKFHQLDEELVWTRGVVPLFPASGKKLENYGEAWGPQLPLSSEVGIRDGSSCEKFPYDFIELAPGIPSLRIEWYTWYTPATPRNMSRFQWRINLSLKVFNPLTNISGNPKTWIQ